MRTSNLAASIRIGREGVQFERSMRSLAYLLHGWCSYPAATPGDPARTSLPVFAFDKFAMSAFRIWNECFRDTGAKLMDAETAIVITDEDDCVLFPCPLQATPGKHGRGLAKRRNGKATYLIELIYRSELDGLMNYFHVVPPAEAPTTPNHHKTIVQPGIVISNEDAHLAPFTKMERDVLKQLDVVFRRMSAEELRAIGTHDSLENTIADIDKEFRDVDRHGHWDNVLQGLASGHPRPFDCQETVEYLDEAIRKSGTNRLPYKSARLHMEREMKDPLRARALSVHRPDNEIWDDPRVIERAKKARHWSHHARYTQLLSHCCETPSIRGNGYAHPVGQALAETSGLLGQLGVSVPHSPSDCFASSGAVHSHIIERLGAARVATI